MGIFGDSIEDFFNSLFGGGDPVSPDEFITDTYGGVYTVVPGGQSIYPPGIDAPDFDLPTDFVQAAIDAPADEEDDQLDEEKRAAAEAARALRFRTSLAKGRSSTFLTRGMDLGEAPVYRKTLLGQGW